MEHIINVTIRNKIATAAKATYIDGNIDYVCGNSDFVVNFDFDAEWDEFNVKTARFIWGRHHQDMVFEGSVCPVPVMTNTERCFVGVFAGHLETTTPAYFPARKSILCPDSVPADPPPDVYAQIMEKLNQALEENDGVAVEKAQVGQMIVVKAVDENGKPTEWEAVKRIGVPGAVEGAEVFNDTVNNVASAEYSHAEGEKTEAKSRGVHAEGGYTSAEGLYSHAEGFSTTASGQHSHAEGHGAKAYGKNSHAEGYGTVAYGEAVHVQGRYNDLPEDNTTIAHVVGNGAPGNPQSGTLNKRSNAHTLEWDGTAWYAGDVYVGGTKRSEGERLAKFSEIPEIPKDMFTATASDGQLFRVKSVDENGKPTELEPFDLFNAPGAVEIVPEITLPLNDDGAVVFNEEVPALTLGAKYLVTLNGEQYICVAEPVEMDGKALGLGLGNIRGLTGSESTGEPFAVVRAADELVAETGYHALIWALGVASPITFSIIRIDVKIKDEFLPNLDSHEQLSMLIEADMLPAVYDSNGAILTDENGNTILRY